MVHVTAPPVEAGARHGFPRRTNLVACSSLDGRRTALISRRTRCSPQHSRTLEWYAGLCTSRLVTGARGDAAANAACVEEAVSASRVNSTYTLVQDWAELHKLVEKLSTKDSYAAKAAYLESLPVVRSFLASASAADLLACLPHLADAERYSLLTLPAMGQGHVLETASYGHVGSYDIGDGDGSPLHLLRSLAGVLVRVDTFYSSLGGLIGYQAKCLELLLESRPSSSTSSSSSAPFSSTPNGSSAGSVNNNVPRRPQGALVSQDSDEVDQEQLLVPWGLALDDGVASGGGSDAAAAAAATAKGLEALPAMAEIYPLGGAGDRLGLVCEQTGQCLPTAVLPYCGRTLLEGLVRDVQAREYLYYRLHGRQHTTPLAIMTSDAKGNHQRVLQLLEDEGWFGRGSSSFRLFRQPMVPVVSAEDGAWLLSGPQQPVMKPGGHGAIWKLMLDEGVFDWLMREHGREAAIVRQISNPLAGTDNMLLALAGLGYPDGRSFGFASCERAVGAAEGINVLRHRKVKAVSPEGKEEWAHEYGVTCVEYTEFERLGVSDQAHDGEGGAGSGRLSKYPANTNILYLGLQAAKAAVVAGAKAGGGAALPGMILNATKKVVCADPATGEQRELPAGRLECTMQNLADSFSQRFPQMLQPEGYSGLDTFVMFNKRRKVTSSAKRRLAPGSLKVAQTPDGSFLDLQRNAHELLTMCGMQVPEPREVEEYLEKGPSFVFLHHPALGPLWDVLRQKVVGGRLAPGAELVLEVAEAQLVDLRVSGSLVIHADNVMGHRHAAHQQHDTGGGVVAPTTPGREPGTEALEVVPHGTYDAAFTEGAGKQLGGGNSSSSSSWGGGSEGMLEYSSTTAARVRMVGCSVANAGVDWSPGAGNVPWKHRLARREGMAVRLEGRSEFEAEGVVFRGDCEYRVPDGFRMVVKSGPDGQPVPELIPLGSRPSWEWTYSLDACGSVRLGMRRSVWWDAGQVPSMLLQGEDMGIMI